MRKLLLTFIALFIFFGAKAKYSYNIINISYDNFLTSGLGGNFLNDLFDYNDGIAPSMNGIGLEYIHGFNLSTSKPVFLETGVKFSVAYGERTDSTSYYWSDNYEIKYDRVAIWASRLSVPISLTYAFTLSPNFAILPFIGLDFRYNTSWEIDKVYKYFELYEDKVTQEREHLHWVSIFDNEIEGYYSKGYRFQFGWHIGLRASIKRILIGVSFGTDIPYLTERKGKNYYSKYGRIKTGSFAVSVGYVF